MTRGSEGIGVIGGYRRAQWGWYYDGRSDRASLQRVTSEWSGIKNGTISTAFAGYSPFSLYYSASHRTKAGAGTLLEEFLGCNVLVKKISQSSEWGACDLWFRDRSAGGDGCGYCASSRHLR